MRRPVRVIPLALAAFAAACGGKPVPSVAVAPAPAVPPDEPREQTLDQQVAQVLSRLTFGARPGDAAAVRAMGVDRFIDAQLHPERIDDAAAERVLGGFVTETASAADLARRFPSPARVANRLGVRAGNRSMITSDDSARIRQAAMGLRSIVTQVQASRVARALLTERQFQEVMTDFWLNHFNVYAQKGGPEPYFLAEYENRVIRPNALGKFRTLLEAVAKSPAMLYYLDNWESQADSTRPRLAAAGGQRSIANRRRGGLNENYGRELLELHTLGVDGGYTQQDVINVARALTGWTFRQPAQGGEFFFNPAMHDAGKKVVLGHRLSAGRGIEDGEDVLDIVARLPATAHFIALKLARRFVSDTPSAALVDRAAETFQRTDGDIREVVRTIVTSPEFFSTSAFRSKVKTPFEVVVSTLRALGAQPDPTPRTAQAVAMLGEPIYGHQAPNGWPDTGDQWMNTGSILSRINFGTAVAARRLPGVSATDFPGAERLRDAPLDQQVDGVIATLLGGAASPDTRAVLLSGKNPLSQASPDSTPPMRRERGLAQVVALAIGSPEFQRR